MLTDANVLITGGAGSVGQYLVSHFLSQDVNVVRVLDNNEPNLSSLKSLVDDSRCRFLAGDVRDKDRLVRAMEGIDIVVHAAAMKHVDISEYNPFEAAKTNVMGLQNVVDAAIDTSVQRVVFTSSDKAVNPANTMGVTKLLGEKLTTGGNKYSGQDQEELAFASVRFGNVINSSQSVIPLFRDQIRNGGPITLTDQRMTRFFLTYNDIANLISEAILQMKGGEIFVHKMTAMRIKDLAEAMREVLAPKYGHDPTDINIEVVGKRVGETLHEEILTEREAARTVENDTMYAVLPEKNNGYLSHDGLEGFQQTDDIVRSSKNASKLGVYEITDFLRTNGALTATEQDMSEAVEVAHD